MVSLLTRRRDPNFRGVNIGEAYERVYLVSLTMMMKRINQDVCE